MKTNRFLLVILCFSILLTLIGCFIENADTPEKEKLTVVGNASYPYYSSIDNLAKKADLIIEGTILDSRVEEIDTRISTNVDDERLNPGFLPVQ